MTVKCAVLLAAFNGERHLYEQVFSLLSQKNVSVDVYIRVDGDSDVFIGLVKRIAAQFENVYLIRGTVDSSSGMNFYNLILSMSNHSYDYYALCDQDDYWSENKLIRAVSCLTESQADSYSSGCTALYSNGRQKVYRLGLQTEFDYMFQSAGPGCTFVFSNGGFIYLQNFLKNNKELLLVSAHDWLIYFIMRLGEKKWVLDKESHIFYKQHSSNVAGINSGINAKLRRIKVLITGWYFFDLVRLHKFSRMNTSSKKFRNPFNLRRKRLHSVFIWAYYHLYVKKRIIEGV